jgi:hypothetical protein
MWWAISAGPLFSRNPGELFSPLRPALSAGFFSSRYRDLGRPPELAQAARPSPWCLELGRSSRGPEPRSVARVSRPGRPGSVTFNQAAVRQLPHAINLLIQLSSGFAGLLPGACNSGRAPWCRPGGYQELDQAVTRSSRVCMSLGRAPWCLYIWPQTPGRRAGPSSAELVPGAWSELPGPSSLVLGSGPLSAQQNRGPRTRVQKTGRVASCAGLGPISHAKCCLEQNWVPFSGQH